MRHKPIEYYKIIQKGIINDQYQPQGIDIKGEPCIQ